MFYTEIKIFGDVCFFLVWRERRVAKTLERLVAKEMSKEEWLQVQVNIYIDLSNSMK